LFLLVDAALTGAQGLEDIAFAIGLMVFAGRLLAPEFEFAQVGLEFLAEVLQVLAENGSELELGGGASGGKPLGVGLGGLGKEAFELCQCFLGTGDLETGLLQLKGALAFDALPEPEYRGESETEGHIQKAKFRLAAP
jgi:hypothetical protein